MGVMLPALVDLAAYVLAAGIASGSSYVSIGDVHASCGHAGKGLGPVWVSIVVTSGWVQFGGCAMLAV